MFETIVVAVDGSPTADRALELAIGLGKAEGAKLAVVSVVDPIVVVGTMPPSPAMDQLLIAEEAEAKRWVQSALERAGNAGLEASGGTLTGVVAHQILAYAKERKASAIVMGTHGRKGLKRLLLGSVAESVLRDAPCPVILVRGEK